jgi:monoterpene epsilon-lactone hydrolase
MRTPNFSVFFKPYIEDKVNVKLLKLTKSYLFIVNEKVNDSCVLYIHGYGYIGGNFAEYKDLTCKISQLSNLPVYFPQYRVAPENHITDSVDDIIESIIYIQKKYKKIAIIADSAGGGLALLTIQKLNLDIYCCMVLMSPFIDLACDGKSHIINNDSDCFLDKDIVKKISKSALTKYHKYDKNVNAFYNDIIIDIPIMITVCSDEILLDDSLRLYNKYKNNTILYVYDNTIHCRMFLYEYIKESLNELHDIIQFIKKN